MWQEAVTLDPGDDPALLSFHGEAVRSLENSTALRRVMAARRPSGSRSPGESAVGDMS